MSTPSPPARMLTTQEVADILNVCTRTVRNLERRGELRAVRIGKAVRFPPDAIADLIQAGSRSSPPQPG